jgi:cyanophycin synthetase
VVLELQNLAGMKTGFGKTRPASAACTRWPSARAKSTWAAPLAAGRDLLMAAINDEPTT